MNWRFNVLLVEVILVSLRLIVSAHNLDTDREHLLDIKIKINIKGRTQQSLENLLIEEAVYLQYFYYNQSNF